MKVFSIDCETNGLWGKPFAIGVVVFENGLEIERFYARIPDQYVTDEYVKAEILPHLPAVTHLSYPVMLKDFATFYHKHRDDAKIVTHMGYICESFLFRELHDHRLIAKFEGPFPMFDVSGHLEMEGENPLSVDEYIVKWEIPTSEGNPHDPLYDAEVAGRVYNHLIQLRDEDLRREEDFDGCTEDDPVLEESA